MQCYTYSIDKDNKKKSKIMQKTIFTQFIHSKTTFSIKVHKTRTIVLLGLHDVAAIAYIIQVNNVDPYPISVCQKLHGFTTKRSINNFLQITLLFLAIVYCILLIN